MIGLQLATVIDGLHKRGLLLGELRQRNILINEKINHVKAGNFGFPSLLTKETGALSNNEDLTGNLPYISPEQTGRMNRSVDYRTDFYSLGTVFYKLLTGAPPFRSTDAMALIHSHIAKEPKPPSAARETIFKRQSTNERVDVLCVQTTLFFDMITKTWEFSEDKDAMMKEDSINGQDRSTCLEQRRINER